MNLGEYLELLRKDPKLYKTAHQLAYEAIMERGYTVKNSKSGEKVTHYHLFREFYGIEKQIEKIVGYFRAAALGGESASQILFLLGPPASGKSDITQTLFRVIDNKEIFVIVGCPIRDEPLTALPRELWDEWQKILGVKFHYSMKPCDTCRDKLAGLGNDYLKLRVAKTKISIADSVGFASADPSDTVSYNKEKYLGSVTLGEKEGDPKAFELDGVFNRGNRGGVELVEFFKNDREVQYHTLELTISKTMESPAGRTSKMYADVFIIAHSNKPEFEKFKKEIANKALESRLFIVEVPYTISYSDQIKIIRKRTATEKYHVAPFTIETVAALTVMSRFAETPGGKPPTLWDKLRIYDGEVIRDYPDINDLKKVFPEDGWTGLHNRESAKLIEEAIAIPSPDEPLCIDPTLIFPLLEKMGLVKLNELAKRWYLDKIFDHFSGVIDDLKGECKRYFEHYLDVLAKIKRGETPNSFEDDLTKIVERDWDNSDTEELRKLTLENHEYARTPEKVKIGIRTYVYEKIVKEALKLLVAKMNKDLKRYREKNELKGRFTRHFIEKLHYCPQCLRRITNWVLMDCP